MTAPFDWTAHNARLDEMLADWRDTEHAISQGHMRLADDLREFRTIIEGITA